MKKVLLSILLAFLPLLASADPIEINGIWYNIIPKGNVAELTSNPSGEKYMGDISIPESISYEGIEYSVSKIGDKTFYGCSNLTSVKIPNSVITIGKSSFEKCSGMISITIPNSVTSIDENAFSGCIGLTNVTIPNSVEFIYDAAFSGCTALKSLNFPNSITKIADNTLSGCKGLTSVTIPNSVTTIGWYAFSGCISLTNIAIPNSVKRIEYGAFTDCTGLTTITIPNSVEDIQNCVFYNCSALTSVTIPNQVKRVFSITFSGCTSLKALTIGKNIVEIDNESFANCSDLTDVFCFAEKVPNTSQDAFKDSYIEYATLHVPASALENYKSAEPWKRFKNKVALKDDDIPTLSKCSTPVISYANGKLTFSCETDGAEFVATITDPDIKTHYGNEINLSQKYNVSVYATKAGFENSDVATREIVIENGQTTLFGDLNKDGKVNVADHVKLSDIIFNKNE